MKTYRRNARINVKFAIIAAVVAVVILVGGAVGYKVRKRMAADRALEAGLAAFDRGQWNDACKQLIQYLNRFPGDSEETRNALQKYADACLRSWPPKIGAAKGAYRRLLGFDTGDDDDQDHDHACEQLVRIYTYENDFTEVAYIAGSRPIA